MMAAVVSPGLLVASHSVRLVLRERTVALLCGELGRWTVGHQCFAALDLPPGSTRRIFSSNVHVPGLAYGKRR